MSLDIKKDCKWFNDVECPYATGYQECDECDKYEPDVHPSNCGCPGCEEARGCDKYHMNKNS